MPAVSMPHDAGRQAAYEDTRTAEQIREDEHFMQLAIEQACRARDVGEVPIGAVVVCDGQVVARGFNRRETDHDPSAHAEAMAMQEASRSPVSTGASTAPMTPRAGRLGRCTTSPRTRGSTTRSR